MAVRRSPFVSALRRSKGVADSSAAAHLRALATVTHAAGRAMQAEHDAAAGAHALLRRNADPASNATALFVARPLASRTRRSSAGRMRRAWRSLPSPSPSTGQTTTP